MHCADRLAGARAEELCDWLKLYQELPYPVLATLSDGEKAIIAALKQSWPDAPHQRCQAHFLNNLAEPVLVVDAELRQQRREELSGVAPVPERMEADETHHGSGQSAEASPFSQQKTPNETPS